jgi:hypothetical protein
MRLVRMPLIRVCIRAALGVLGAAGGWLGAAGSWGDVPLADCGGRVVVAACGGGCSVMTVFPS